VAAVEQAFREALGSWQRSERSTDRAGSDQAGGGESRRRARWLPARPGI